MKELEKFNVKVFGVSTDSVEAQKKFHTKQKLNYQLLADSEKKVIRTFGVKTLAGKFAARQSFLVKDGKLVWRDLKVKPKTHAKVVIEALKGI